jgi:general stress protein YciG
MAGNKAGGIKAAATNKAKYGVDYYKSIGALGGSIGRTGGFYANKELAVKAGRKGGIVSRRVWTPEERKAQSEAMKKQRGNRHAAINL